MKESEILKAQEILIQQLSEARVKFGKTKKEKDCLWEQFRNAKSEDDKEKLEQLNKEKDKEYYELLNAIDRIPNILSSIGNIITGEYIDPINF